ncbi:MAG: hypothetical protein HY298_01960 [Verrucomicrobia bacterium]|nr:hypothetical protein [Verrucomicrobiota bacterium]
MTNSSSKCVHAQSKRRLANEQRQLRDQAVALGVPGFLIRLADWNQLELTKDSPSGMNGAPTSGDADTSILWGEPLPMFRHD